jgi:hypothetical protein
MQPRVHFTQSASLYQRFNEEARRLRKETKDTQPGIESHIKERLPSRGLRMPK